MYTCTETIPGTINKKHSLPSAIKTRDGNKAYCLYLHFLPCKYCLLKKKKLLKGPIQVGISELTEGRGCSCKFCITHTGPIQSQTAPHRAWG